MPLREDWKDDPVLDDIVQDHIGRQLKAMYAALPDAAVPDHLRDLLAQLEDAASLPAEAAS